MVALWEGNMFQLFVFFYSKARLTFAAQDGGRALDQLPDLLQSSVCLCLGHGGGLRTQVDG